MRTAVFLWSLVLPLVVWGETPLLTVRQGDVAALTLPVTTEGANAVVGVFQDRTIPFFEVRSSSFLATSTSATSTRPRLLTALLGVDMEQPEGSYPFHVTVKEKSGPRTLQYFIKVVPADFETQTLTLPKDKVDLDAKTLERVEREAALFQDVFRRPDRPPLWEEVFLTPVLGEISGKFGLRRIINGEKKNPHTGVDIAAPLGEKVIAANEGQIILTGDFFFNGQSVVLDHGGGIMTMYFHLSEISVKEGMTIKKGDMIGKVGQSGRATGPHLHWGARVHGARVDPFQLIKALEQNPASHAFPGPP